MGYCNWSRLGNAKDRRKEGLIIDSSLSVIYSVYVQRVRVLYVYVARADVFVKTHCD